MYGTNSYKWGKQGYASPYGRCHCSSKPGELGLRGHLFEYARSLVKFHKNSLYEKKGKDEMDRSVKTWEGHNIWCLLKNLKEGKYKL